ncbi:hypothetical protein CC85DRAFT_304887 [Cutaneotrichosporon oleaginosum]|uniref:Uncharacterized protein n=1 Tax=Cutaneotrichosporon oleaginosum TaxID=879819 RepID=A0A0J0XEV6_9TREE|nr:uncharacterized protein CC85DRAFT_304887 [Cutaneotrichosporon oleaginosum]KLT39583.1 hypothetical protein CC85DRAFT_304887 [Cutaneotrichosporon oleaginosum]TXT15489.1 hypothetical protein COLE_01682 [Cutaneotrichosporon oleaginosum]
MKDITLHASNPDDPPSYEDAINSLPVAAAPAPAPPPASGSPSSVSVAPAMTVTTHIAAAAAGVRADLVCVAAGVRRELVGTAVGVRHELGEIARGLGCVYSEAHKGWIEARSLLRPEPRRSGCARQTRPLTGCKREKDLP